MQKKYVLIDLFVHLYKQIFGIHLTNYLTYYDTQGGFLRHFNYLENYFRNSFVHFKLSFGNFVFLRRRLRALD